MLFCSDWLWHYYGGLKTKRWVAWALVFSFTPTLYALKLGQVSPLILLGLVGFLYFEQKARFVSAGTCLLLITLKPQLTYLVPVFVLFSGISKKRACLLWGSGFEYSLLQQWQHQFFKDLWSLITLSWRLLEHILNLRLRRSEDFSASYFKGSHAGYSFFPAALASSWVFVIGP